MRCVTEPIGLCWGQTLSKGPRILSFPDLRRIEEEAAEWVAISVARDLSAAERLQFEGWLRRGAAQRDAWRRMLALWQGTAPSKLLQELRELVERIEPQVEHRRRRRAMVAIAASALVAALGVFVVKDFRWTAESTQIQAFATERGVQRTVSLVDGSTMVLNVDSRAEVNINGRERRIHLHRGEAYFQVAHDVERPFVVDTGAKVVRATGTAFSVSVVGERIEVLVDQGRVEVSEQPPSVASPRSAIARRPVALPATPLTVGQRAVVDAGVTQIESLAPMDLERRLSWREGVIVFAGEPLSEVVGEMSRYSGVPIIIEDDRLRAIPIGGRFQVGDVDSMLEGLESLFGVEVRRDPDGVAHIDVRR